MSAVREILRDTATIARIHFGRDPNWRDLAVALSYDGSVVLALSRLREAALRRGIPIAGGILRRLQTALFGVEISSGARLGEGVVFLHPVGIVIGSEATIGDRVMFLGNNTIGSVGRKGYPTIGNDVIIGAGARVLGPVHIGDGAAIGANAVVLVSVPAGAVAAGVPAVVRERPTGTTMAPAQHVAE